MVGEEGAEGTGRRVLRLPAGTAAAASRRAVAQVEAYWTALKGERLLPLRSEIDPRGMEGALDHAFIVERIAPGIARFRLAGTALADLMGMEVRGMPLSALVVPDSRRALAEAVEGVFSGPETLRLELEGERGLGRPPLAARMVLLPLKSDLGDVTRALGCIAASGELGRTPRRFRVQSAARVDLLTGRPPERRAAPAPAARPAAASAGRTGFAEGAAPFRRAPYLRLVKTDRED